VNIATNIDCCGFGRPLLLDEPEDKTRRKEDAYRTLNSAPASSAHYPAPALLPAGAASQHDCAALNQSSSAAAKQSCYIQ